MKVRPGAGAGAGAGAGLVLLPGAGRRPWTAPPVRSTRSRAAAPPGGRGERGGAGPCRARAGKGLEGETAAQRAGRLAEEAAEAADEPAAAAAGGAEGAEGPVETVREVKERLAAREAERKGSPVQFSTTKRLSEADLAAMQDYVKSEGLQKQVKGALLESRLIEWPDLKDAAVSTGIVLGMVVGVTVVVTGINFALSTVAEVAFPI